MAELARRWHQFKQGNNIGAAHGGRNIKEILP